MPHQLTESVRWVRFTWLACQRPVFCSLSPLTFPIPIPSPGVPATVLISQFIGVIHILAHLLTLLVCVRSFPLVSCNQSLAFQTWLTRIVGVGMGESDPLSAYRDAPSHLQASSSSPRIVQLQAPSSPRSRVDKGIALVFIGLFCLLFICVIIPLVAALIVFIVAYTTLRYASTSALSSMT